jgi:carboxymethylenebutenolidase
MSDRVFATKLAIGMSVLTLAACVHRVADPHAGHSMPAASSAASSMTAASGTSASTTGAAGSTTVAARLAASPRHAEWAMIRTPRGDSVKAWVVYPQRRDKAPVVIVVHEIFGLSSWIRGVADQLAADGFIAIAPDLLTGKLPGSPTDTTNADAARAAIRTLDPAIVQEQLDAVAQYGMALPAASKRYGIVGFCWGGSTSFLHAVHSPSLGASVVYYGTSPPAEKLDSVRAPVLGLYGGLDNRVNATIARADSALKGRGIVFEQHIFEGAGHGFLRQQDGENGPANSAAAQAAWPLTIAWFRRYLGS